MSPRTPLSRDVILGEAVALVDERGLTELTMRRLGERLGVEAMSLYRYVEGREALLDGIVEQVTADLDLNPYEPLLPSDGWQAYLQVVAAQVRAIALRHPRVFPLVATRNPAAPWLRPPLRSLDLVEAFLEGLIRRGFTDAGAVASYRAFSSFLLGHLLLESAALGAETAPDLEPLAEPEQRDVAQTHHELDAYPQLQRLEDQLSSDRSAQEFEESLEQLLDSLERFVA
ncbi:MAG: TetR/AcrR family transcriptional regulator C-terminal domain-containing protein [Actinomycetota bacterium]